MSKMTFRQWLDNFWYHYKYTVLLSSVFIIFMLVSVSQMIVKKSPDANFLYMGTASISFSSQGLLQESASVFMKEDYNKDGKKSIDYIELTVLDPEKAQNFDKTTYTNREIDKASGERFIAELVAGDSMIYLTDEKYYKMALEQNLVMPLEDILPVLPEYARDSYSVYLRDLDIFYLPGFNKLPSDTVLFIRYPVSLADSKKELEEREKNNLSVFRDMVSYVYPDKPEDKVKKAKRVTEEEFLSLYNEFCEKNNIHVTENLEFSELTSTDTFEKSGATIYKCESRTFLIFDGVLYSIGRFSSGLGVSDLELCDFDNNGIFDFLFTYSYMDNDLYSAKASVFNLSLLKETPLNIASIKQGAVYLIEKISDGSFEIWESIAGEEDFTNTLPLYEKSKRVCSLLSDNKSIVKKTYK